jgi:hypothetical protein
MGRFSGLGAPAIVGLLVLDMGAESAGAKIGLELPKSINRIAAPLIDSHAAAQGAAC